jgi:pyruvate formate lyase activating enzyme
MDGSGLVFDIQRFSLHDGSGIRTLVFLKGCPLRCPWCCNPESQLRVPELLRFPSRCIGCGACRGSCPQDAAAPDASSPVDRTRCLACGSCADSCPTGAREVRGRWMRVAEVLREAERDRLVYRATGGGVTVSGGEPLQQPGFVAELLQACRSRGLHAVLETCGHAPWEDCQAVFAHADTVLFDVKHLDPVAHQRATGVGNEQILGNLRSAAESGVPLVMRMPLIPGFNAEAPVVREVAALARDLGILDLHLLPYHALGEAKHAALGRRPPLPGLGTPSAETLRRLVRAAESAGPLRIRVGG